MSQFLPNMTYISSEQRWHLEAHLPEQCQLLLKYVKQCEPIFVDENRDNSEKFLLNSADHRQGNLKCVATLRGFDIVEADLRVERSNGKHPYKASIREGSSYRLQQLQDSSNYFSQASAMLEDLILLLQEASEIRRPLGRTLAPATLCATLGHISGHLKLARDSIIAPRKRTVDELVNPAQQECFHPNIPQDMSLSFYIAGQRLLMAVYHIGHNARTRQSEVVGRGLVDCVVPWLNDLVLALTRAIQQCQQMTNQVRLHLMDPLQAPPSSVSVSAIRCDGGVVE